MGMILPHIELLEKWTDAGLPDELILRGKLHKFFSRILKLDNIDVYNVAGNFTDWVRALFKKWCEVLPSDDRAERVRERKEILMRARSKRERVNAIWNRQYEVEMASIEDGLWRGPILSIEREEADQDQGSYSDEEL